MNKLVITGGKKLQGKTVVSGAKNVALKALIAACLTDEVVEIKNIPLISDFHTMVEIIEELGGTVDIQGHTAKIQCKTFKKHEISLDVAARIRTSLMFLAPLLSRVGEAIIPNPGGCRLGARPIDRVIEGFKQMGAQVVYKSDDGYFHAKLTPNAEGVKRLNGTTYHFKKNTHTGTETLLLASVLAEGKTVLENAAEEPEIDELIILLNRMGADVTRTESRRIEINGVKKLHGASYTICPDRNEIVTFAIAALITKGDITIDSRKNWYLDEFIEKVKEAGGGVEELENGIRFFYNGPLKAVNVTTSPYPGFMTDWQAPWVILMTQAKGESVIHETVFENKFGYISDLKKMGASAKLFNPKVLNREEVYNFNLDDDQPEFRHAVKIKGPTQLHNAVANMVDLRAGAAIVLAALAAKGTSTIFGIDKLDRGYEDFEKRLQSLGATIERLAEEEYE